MSQTGRAMVRGGSLRVISLGVNLVLQMAMLPYILRHLGERDYGIWSVVGAVTGYYGLLDLGVSSAVTRFVSREIGRNNFVGAGNYIAASKRVFRWTALAVAVLAVVIAIAGSRFVSVAEDRELFSVTVLLTGLGVALSFPSRVQSGILEAELRHDIFAVLTLSANVLRAAATFVVLDLDGGLIGLATVNSGVSVLQALATTFVVRRLYRHLPVVRSVAAGTTREILGYAGFASISMLADFARFRVHPLTISAFLRFSDVTTYAIHDRLQAVVVDVCNSFLSMLSVVFSRQEGRQDHAAMKQLYLLSYKFSCYVGTYFLGILVIMAPAFVEKWLGPGYGLVVQLLYVRVVGSLCGIIQMPSVQLLVSTSEYRTYSLTNVIHAVATLVSTVWLVQGWGLMGVVVGVSMCTAFMKTCIQAFVACRVLKMRFMDLHLWHTLPNVGRVLVFLIPVAVVGQYWLQPSWWRLITFAGFVLPAFVAYIYLVGFDRSERGLLRRSAGFA